MAQIKMHLKESTDRQNQTGHPFHNPEEVVDHALAGNPVIRRGVIPKNLLAIVDVAKPPSHQRADFMVTHRTLVDDTCAACHGEIR